MPGPEVVFGINIGLRRVITGGAPCELLGMEIGLSRGIAFVILGLYVLSNADIDSSVADLR